MKFLIGLVICGVVAAQPPNPIQNGLSGRNYQDAVNAWFSWLNTNKATTTSVSGKEPALGNPATNGFCLTSLTNGTRSWASCGSGSSPWVTVESFGAVCDGSTDDTVAIQAALDSVGSATSSPIGGGSVVIPAGKICLVSATLNINKSYINFFGAGLGMAQSTIKTTSTTTDIIKINGSGSGNCAAGAIYFSSVSNMDLRRVTPATAGNGLSIVKGCWIKVEEVQAVDSINNFYVQLSGNTLIHRTQAAWTTDPGTSRSGIFVDSSSSGANFSTRIKHALVAGGQSNLTGLKVSGDCIADTFVEDFETSFMKYGIQITSTAGSGTAFNYCNGDVHIHNPIIDSNITAGIQVNNVIGGGVPYVGVSGGFIRASTGDAVDIENSHGVSIMGMQLIAPAGAGVLLNGGNSLINRVTGNSIQISQTGVSLVNASVNQITSNTFWSTVDTVSTTHISIGAGSNGNQVSENILEGYATTGILLNATAAGNRSYPNIIDTTHIGTAVTDSGTGNLTAGITASGSSCAITAINQGIITAATCTP